MIIRLWEHKQLATFCVIRKAPDWASEVFSRGKTTEEIYRKEDEENNAIKFEDCKQVTDDRYNAVNSF